MLIWCPRGRTGVGLVATETEPGCDGQCEQVPTVRHALRKGGGGGGRWRVEVCVTLAAEEKLAHAGGGFDGGFGMGLELEPQGPWGAVVRPLHQHTSLKMRVGKVD